MPTGSELSENHVSDLIPGYALDCLDSPERLLVSEHLAHCSQCQAELQGYRMVVDNLYLAAPQAAPPPGLKAKLLGDIPKKQPSYITEKPASIWERLRSSLSSNAPAWALAGLVIVLILAGSNLWLWQRGNRLAAAAPGNFRVIAMAGTDQAPKATGVLVMNPEGDQGTLVVDDLPPLDGSHQYQLWLLQNDQRDSGGVFSVSPAGYGSLMVNSERPLYQYTGFGITIEPAGGSPGPTGDKVMGGKLPQSRLLPFRSPRQPSHLSAQVRPSLSARLRPAFQSLALDR